MGNFQFIKGNWPEIHQDCARAESYVGSDPRSACFYSRRAVEVLVQYLYDLEGLEVPYREDLAARMNESAFTRITGQGIQAKLNLIRKVGNTAVHQIHPVPAPAALQILRELHHVMIWAAQRYTSHPGQVPTQAAFDPQLVVQAAPLSRQDVQNLAAKFTEQDEKHRAELEASQSKLVEKEAEIERLRAQLAEGQRVNRVRDDRDYNEAETRTTFIDVLLREAGWSLDGPRDTEFEVTGLPTPSGVGYVDYVLWGADGRPLGLVEAKRTGASAVGAGQQQAELYADALECAYGQRPVIFLSNGYEHWIWDDAAGYPPRSVQGFRTRHDLELMVQRRTTQQPLSGAPVNEDIAGRAYQTRAIRAVGKDFDQKRRAALLVMATGSGKTRTAVALVEQLMKQNWVKRVLFLADRTALVDQAFRNFVTHLPSSSPVNLLEDKQAEGRVYLSTYPTMLNLIQDNLDNERRFGPGYFDLVIIDEAHRSVYQKFGAIFEYFDSLLLGLTATPKDDIDHNTYRLFHLEDGVPTDAYTLEEAVTDGYLVPPRGIEIATGFMREGIRYDQLNQDEQAQWEELEWGDDDVPDQVGQEDVNRVLFNTDTVDKVLAVLMERGYKVANGDRLGKTIIFARNQRHAEFIQRRFDEQYPEHGGQFARVITHQAFNAGKLITDFSDPEKSPHIAVSVDMLDTGIDIPDAVNLVFFKPVRSKTKFWQMIGRGTRLRPNLFGPGRHKQDFLVFDCCGNLEFFNQDIPEGRGSVQKSLNQRVFGQRLRLLRGLDGLLSTQGLGEGETALRNDTAQSLCGYISGMTTENFLVRPHRRLVERFVDLDAWRAIDDVAAQDLMEHVAGLPTSGVDHDEGAKAFDLMVLRYQVAVLEGDPGVSEACRLRIQAMADQLRGKDRIPAVRQELALLEDVAGDGWWESVTLPMLEHMRKRLRALAMYIEKTSRNAVYTDFMDTLDGINEVDLRPAAPGTDQARFKEKARAFVLQHADHITIQRLRRNKQLTADDLHNIEQLMIAHGVGDQSTLEEAAATNQGLGLFIRSLVGMERADVAVMFSAYLNRETHTVEQIRFVELVIDELTRNGALDPGRLYEKPFSDIAHQGPEEIFDDLTLDGLIDLSTEVRRRALPSDRPRGPLPDAPVGAA